MIGDWKKVVIVFGVAVISAASGAIAYKQSADPVIKELRQTNLTQADEITKKDQDNAALTEQVDSLEQQKTAYVNPSSSSATGKPFDLLETLNAANAWKSTVGNPR